MTSELASPEASLSMCSPQPSDALDAAIEVLVSKVVAKFSRGEISLDEASVRLLGTGRYEEKEEALAFLRTEVCPQIEEQLRALEDDIARLRAQAALLRTVLGLDTPQTSLLVPELALAHETSAQPPAIVRSKKEKSGAEKKRRGAASDPAPSTEMSPSEAMLPSAEMSPRTEWVELREATEFAESEESAWTQPSP